VWCARDQIITFNEFEPGTFDEKDTAIAQLVNATRDEGFEDGETGFTARIVADNRTARKAIPIDI